MMTFQSPSGTNDPHGVSGESATGNGFIGIEIKEIATFPSVARNDVKRLGHGFDQKRGSFARDTNPLRRVMQGECGREILARSSSPDSADLI
jgi:hypothetical protein